MYLGSHTKPSIALEDFGHLQTFFFSLAMSCLFLGQDLDSCLGRPHQLTAILATPFVLPA